MALRATSRRSWRRSARVLVFVPLALFSLYYFTQSHSYPLKGGADREPDPLALTRPTIRKPKPPKPQHKWTELWEAKSDGKLVVPIDEKGNAISKIGFTRHPLLDLVEEAERKWNATLQRCAEFLTVHRCASPDCFPADRANPWKKPCVNMSAGMVAFPRKGLTTGTGLLLGGASS